MVSVFRQPPFTDWPPRLWQALFAAWCLFWLLMISVAVQDNWSSPDFRWWQPLVWELSSALVLSGIVLLMFLYGARQQHLLPTPLLWFWQHVLWLPLVSAVFVVLTFSIRHGIYAVLGEPYIHATWLQVWLYETVKLGLFLGLWLGVIFGIHAFIAARAQQLNLQTLQRALTEARLQQLKAQLEPHFLFNTLNTISALMHSDVARADRLLGQLADLLRARLTHDDRQLVPLHEELRLLHLYADIMCARFAPRVQLQWDIDPAALSSQLPVMLLQPLLENVFRHEVERTTAVVQVIVEARLDAQQLELMIRNSVSATGTAVRGSGVGLHNCRERLLALYGPAAVLVTQREESTFCAVLRLPMQKTAFSPEHPT